MVVDMAKSGWTIETLREHFDTRLAEKDLRDQQRFEGQGVALAAARAADRELVAAALTAADRAVQKAETAADRRAEGQNEFRATLSDQAARLATKDELETKVGALSDRITALATAAATQQGSKTGLRDGWGYLVGAVGIIATIATLTGHLH
jgi:hypothetical protein